MATPYLRILIVDDQPLQRLSIEKAFNSNGYYRIAPVESFDEFLLLAAQAADQFDLVVINSGIKGCTLARVEELLSGFSICNMLMYEGQPPEVIDAQEFGGKKIFMKLPGRPDDRTIKDVMQLVDLKKTEASRRKVTNLFRHV
ncbi:hypothetical protein [Pseudomonas edaphica]|uniref:hypothetical protein n=1 Tax=Pseudomonas edaphica TaxID=2006980 RepID=UPI001486AE38|nr:hypothetical protein [Pseudomonas edaphica]